MLGRIVGCSHSATHSATTSPCRAVPRAFAARISSLAIIAIAISGALPLLAQGPPPPPPPIGPVPPVPVPAANPLTPAKAILGKILFWDEQLSSDDSIACGTCHIPGAGGSDPRSVAPTSVHPSADGLFGTADDVAGSLGMPRLLCDGTELEDSLFGFERQVTRRKSPSPVMAGYAPSLFWDGRAIQSFVDPETGLVAASSLAALETQSVGPILSSVEMGCDGRTWDDVRQELAAATPLALATDLPADIVAALAVSPDYPSLFAAAFGTPEIDARRIAFALASYQRTLVADQTPFDAFIAQVPGALSPAENQGRILFNQFCLPCHGGPLLTDQFFHRIGVRPVVEDLGRGAITGNPVDNGRFKTPSLRNVALRAPYFHNGGKATLAEVIEFYSAGGDFPNPGIAPFPLSATQRAQLEAFLAGALTDPRVAAELPPFDRPTLRAWFRRGDANQDGAFDISDPIAVLLHLFQGGAPPSCADAADSNDDGSVDVADVVASLGRLFQGTAPLPAPSERRSGPDPTSDPLGC